MPRWRRTVVTLVAYVVFGLALPVGALLWLIFHYEPAYVVDESALATPQTAFAPHASIRRVQVPYGAGRGATAVYPDTSVATIVLGVASSEATIDAYAARLRPVSSTSTSFRNYTQRDMRLPSGRVARAYGIADTVLLFAAPNPDALDALIARTPALERNTRRGIGNVVFDDHRVSAIVIGAGSFVVWAVITAMVMIRLALPAPTGPAPGVPAVPPEELGRRLLALADGTHPFTVASRQPGEYFVDWRYDDAWETFFMEERMRTLQRIRLRLDPATRTVGATDFVAEFDSASGERPDPFAAVRWRVFRGYTLVQKEISFGGGSSYRFDIADMRRPIIATVTGAGWTYRPRM